MSSPKVQQVGGSGTGLGTNFAQWLNQALMGGTFGGGAGGGNAAGGMNNILNDILSPGAGKMGGALGQLIQNQKQMDVSGIRGRFGASGGMSFGSPAAFGESNYLAKEAPSEATAIGGLQMQALGPILQMLMGTANKDISQRQTIVSPSDFSSAMGILAPILGVGVKAATGGMGSVASGSFDPSMVMGGSNFKGSTYYGGPDSN